MEIVAQFYESDAWRVQIRLYDATGRAIEPIAAIPMATWLTLDEAGRADAIDVATRYVRLHHPQLLDEDPTPATAPETVPGG